MSCPTKRCAPCSRPELLFSRNRAGAEQPAAHFDFGYSRMCADRASNRVPRLVRLFINDRRPRTLKLRLTTFHQTQADLIPVVEPSQPHVAGSKGRGLAGNRGVRPSAFGAKNGGRGRYCTIHRVFTRSSCFLHAEKTLAYYSI